MHFRATPRIGSIKNGWSVADSSDADIMNDISDNKFSAAGIIKIPVCSAEEACNNWGKTHVPNPKYSDTLPCE
jgi:hypothetical protein